MEYQPKFKRHVRSHIEFIASGQYRKAFKTPAATKERPEYKESRRRALCSWTMEVLADQNRQN